MKTLKRNKGITLIALVITIIVMLILVAVTINMAVNGGLFGYAGNASAQTKTARDSEQDYTNIESGLSYSDLIEKYTNYGGEEYPSDGWAMAWTCTNNSWSGEYETSDVPQGGLTGDVIAKVYERENDRLEGVVEYHLIIEKGNGTGQMGALIALSESSVKVAQYSLMGIDTSKSFLLAAKQTVYAWQRIRSQITKVIIRDGVTNIGNGAFESCTNLIDITIPVTVTNIAYHAFYGCTKLTTITYSGTSDDWREITKGNNWGPTITTINCSDGTVDLSTPPRSSGGGDVSKR